VPVTSRHTEQFDVLVVAEIGLGERERVVSVVGKLVSARVPQHVRCRPNVNPAGVLDQLGETGLANGAALRHKQIFGVVCFSLESSQRAARLEWMDAWHADLEPPHVRRACFRFT
jgi:hypothetical protein